MKNSFIKCTFLLAVLAIMHGTPVVHELNADDDTAINEKTRTRNEVRVLLETGVASGSLPDGVVIRVSANLFGVDDKKIEAAKARGEVIEESLKEAWDITSTEIHRLVYDAGDNDKYSYRRVETRKFDSKHLCKVLLEGDFLEIGTGKGTGKPAQYVGTHFRLGGRSIDFSREGESESLLSLYELCTGPGYPKSDACKFALLYEQLAHHAREAFKSIAVKP